MSHAFEQDRQELADARDEWEAPVRLARPCPQCGGIPCLHVTECRHRAAEEDQR